MINSFENGITILENHHQAHDYLVDLYNRVGSGLHRAVIIHKIPKEFRKGEGIAEAYFILSADYNVCRMYAEEKLKFYNDNQIPAMVYVDEEFSIGMSLGLFDKH